MSEIGRRLLPLLGHGGGRDAMTCLYRCGNACDHPVPNESTNPYLGDLVGAEVSRRAVMRGSAAGALVLGFAGTAAAASPASAATPLAGGTTDSGATTDSGGAGGDTGAKAGPLTFKPIPPNTLDTFIVPTATTPRW